MIQEIVIPEKTVSVNVAEIIMNITDTLSVKGKVIMAKTPVGVTRPPQFLPTSVNITQIITDELAATNLTNADIQGFKKVIKAIIANAMEIAYSEVSEPL